MAQPSEKHPWFAPTSFQVSSDDLDSKSKGPSEFERLWRGFMTARVTLGLMLLVLQGTLWSLSPSAGPLLIFICGGYFAAALAVRFYASPRYLARRFDPQWLFTIGIDIATFSALQFLQGGGINYAPLLALPVLMASVLGALYFAVGTAATVTLILLSHSAWLALSSAGNTTANFVQSALTGAACFVLAFLANQLSTRLAQEEQRSQLNQRAVHVQRQVNELVIESLTDGVLVVDASGVVRAANPAARQMLGSATPMREASFSLLAEPAWSGLASLAGQSFVRVELRRTDVTVHHAGQGIRRLRVRTRQTVNTSDDSESLCVMFLQDQREMEARMRTEKLASMGRMSAAVAHEIRNPLAAITQANALLDEDITDPKQKQLTQMVAQNAHRLGKIVEEVLNISRVQERDSAASAFSLALDDRVNRIAQDWSSQNGTQSLALIELGAENFQVAFEPEHLRRVLINLLDNARRYASGAPASIRLQTALNEDGQGSLSVWSDGQPLDQSVERHLFEPFFSSESRSSGLGLYICRELCEGHGATIIYRRSVRHRNSEDTQGNDFYVTFRTARANDRPESK